MLRAVIFLTVPEKTSSVISAPSPLASKNRRKFNTFFPFWQEHADVDAKEVLRYDRQSVEPSKER
jgi:hypothetical protein